MPRYANGFIPEWELVIFRRGTNDDDGDWYWGLTPATYARHRLLLQRAANRTGRWLEPSDGFGCYRPYASQVRARAIYGNGAAWPGTSSHGGWWESRDTMAIDYSNWSWVYSGDMDAFFADCYAVGLTPGMIMPARGYPREPWHVIDTDPWGAVPAGGGSLPFVEEDVPLTQDQAAQLIQAKNASVNTETVVREIKALFDDRRDGEGNEIKGLTRQIGEIHQAIYERLDNGGQWDGMDKVGTDTLDLVKGIPKLLTGLTGGTSEATPAPTTDEIATAVREKFKTEPLS